MRDGIIEGIVAVLIILIDTAGALLLWNVLGVAELFHAPHATFVQALMAAWAFSMFGRRTAGKTT